MNNHQRGIYQPLMDNIPVYDLSEEEVEEETRSRLPLLIVIALVVLAAFAGVVWLAYNQGVSRGRASAALVINAPDGPVRTAPADAGGAETPYTGLQVYRPPVAPDQEAQTSVLAPAAPAPVAEALPAPAPTPPVAKPNIVAPPPVIAEAPALRLNPDSGVSAARQPAPPAAASSAARQTPAPKAVAPATTLAKTPPAPAKEAAAVAPLAAAGGPVLQIGAYDSEDIANGAWANFKSRHPAMANLSRDIQKADLGAKGIWYRLRVGPFVDKAAAVAACEKLRAEGGTCFVTAP